MAEKKHGFSRTFLVVVGGLLVLVFAAYMWGVQTVLFFKMRSEQKTVPLLGFTPQELPSLLVNQNAGTKLRRNGCAFEVPWTDADETKSKESEHFSVFAFHSGYRVEVFGPDSPDQGLASTAQRAFDGADSETFRRIIGPETIASNYRFEKAALEETPSRIRPWTNKREAIRAMFLLVVKLTSSVGGDTGIFSVQAKGWRGFQFGDPEKKPKTVVLKLFDARDRQVEIVFWHGDGPPNLTQADINRSIRTLSSGESMNETSSERTERETN